MDWEGTAWGLSALGRRAIGRGLKWDWLRAKHWLSAWQHCAFRGRQMAAGDQHDCY
jgi:hypothetical protein